MDATGDDSNVGSEGAPWKTIAAVNSATFGAGDRVLFKRGETFTLTEALTPRTGVTYAAYGSGAKPILDGGNTKNGVFASNTHYLRFENLDVRNAYDFGFYFQTCTHIEVVNCDVNRAGNDCLNFFGLCDTCGVTGGVFQGAYERVVGPAPSGIECADGARNITIDGIESFGHTGAASSGITIHNHSAPAKTPMPTNIIIRNAYCHNTTGEYDMVIFNQSDTAGHEQTNIQVTNSRFEGATLDGVRITKAGAITNYPGGSIVFDGCRIIGPGRYAVWAEGDDWTFRRCVLHGGRMLFSRSCKRGKIYNSTLYMPTGGGYRPISHDDYAERGDTDITVKNCIIASPDAATQLISVLTGTADIDYNIYERANATDVRWRWGADGYYSFANWKTNSGQDAHSSVTTDAKFTDAANDDFTIAVDSPAVDAGVVIAGVTDGYLGVAPDCGYVETA